MISIAVVAFAVALDVISYDVRLVLHPADGSLQGEETIRLHAEPRSKVSLGAAGLEVESVRGRSDALRFERVGDEVEIELGEGREHEIGIKYVARTGPGIEIGADAVWGAYHTWKWMVASRAPSDRARLMLSLDVPAEFSVAASGRFVKELPAAKGRVRRQFELDRPHPAYTFGFAAAPLETIEGKADGVTLRIMAPAELARRLQPALDSTASILRFMAERAGSPFPHKTYTQVFLPEAPAQEMAGMALMSAAYAQSLVADPEEDWLVAHEASHQWWGNLVTAAHWGEFWLNEGFASFMGAAWKEQAWGTPTYQREVALAYERLGRARREGRNRPLVLAATTPESNAGGAIPYQRGFLLLDTLRRELGNDVFWKGVRTYTRSAPPEGVTSAALRTAMEKESGRSLGAMFSAWTEEESPECAAPAAQLPAVQALVPPPCG